MGLKQAWDYHERVSLEGLKSDQNGIETGGLSMRSGTSSRLKSDQNGIETIFRQGILSAPSPVKIRPKWD